VPVRKSPPARIALAVQLVAVCPLDHGQKVALVIRRQPRQQWPE
jgi:hypothetical protein